MSAKSVTKIKKLNLSLRSTQAIGVVVLATLLVGCASGGKKGGEGSMTPVYYGLAEMRPTKGNKVSGQVLFSESFGKVNVDVKLTGLEPNSKHGFHIHEFGDCSAPDAMSAGSHFNPGGHAHGNYTDEVRHAGDLGNVTADKKGEAKIIFSVEKLSISGQLNPVLGRAVIVHENADDLVSQPVGGAGARLACGVIGASTR